MNAEKQLSMYRVYMAISIVINYLINGVFCIALPDILSTSVGGLHCLVIIIKQFSYTHLYANLN